MEICKTDIKKIVKYLGDASRDVRQPTGTTQCVSCLGHKTTDKETK